MPCWTQSSSSEISIGCERSSGTSAGDDASWSGGGGGGGAGGEWSSVEAGGNYKPGDWICPSCKHVNMSQKDACMKCGTQGRGQARLGMKPGDWICPMCGDLVFASKSNCSVCSAAKPGTGGCCGGGGGPGGRGRHP
mmetsp:Transcript_81730/g.230047  ORF Transcript_81730/g.230047 Transcript_81730/m.230047 type:complete len:137 (-) Transcript_81730:600-1010(-)